MRLHWEYVLCPEYGDTVWRILRVLDVSCPSANPGVWPTNSVLLRTNWTATSCFQTSLPRRPYPTVCGRTRLNNLKVSNVTTPCPRDWENYMDSQVSRIEFKRYSNVFKDWYSLYSGGHSFTCRCACLFMIQWQETMSHLTCMHTRKFMPCLAEDHSVFIVIRTVAYVWKADLDYILISG